ncbi:MULTISPECIES: hypothetical protein [Alphaproteobacteria]|uniref:helix-turn-helix transcriptional regulator n=1 Tax=Alphaproteobacteria TaxID=28211 RepID=UPI0032655B8A
MQTRERDSLTQIVACIYESVHAPESWEDFLSILCNLSGAYSAALHCHDTEFDRNIGIAAHGLDPGYLTSYRTEFSPLNPWTPHIIHAPVGFVQRGDASVDPADLLNGRFYNEWLRPQEDLRGSAGVTVWRNSSRFIRLSCSLRHKDQDKLEGLLSTLELVAPHLQSAVRLTQSKRPIDEHFDGLFSALGGAFWLLDGHATVCFASCAAEQIQRTGSMVSIDRSGVLRIADSVAHEAVTKALSEIASGDLLSLRPISVWDGSHVTEAFVSPFREGSHTNCLVDGWLKKNQPIAALYMPPPTRRREPGESFDGFRLTTTEKALCYSLCTGQSLRQYSEMRGVSVQTARKQLKSIFAKTGIGRQSQLVAIMSNKIESLQPPPEHTIGEPSA